MRKIEYFTKIVEHQSSEYDGHFILKIDNQEIKAYYLAPELFVKKIHQENQGHFLVDLWMVIGCVKKTKIHKYSFFCDKEFSEGIIQGRILQCFSQNEFRVKSELEIDIEVEKCEFELFAGDSVEVKGSYQIYFPNTEWAREKVV